MAQTASNNLTVGAPSQKRVGRRDQQLMILMMCEVLLYIITNLPFSINITYGAITADIVKSTDRMRIEAFIGYLSTPFLIIINNCAPFYLYLCVSSKFRQDVKDFVLFWRRRRRVIRDDTQMRTKVSGTTGTQQPTPIQI